MKKILTILSSVLIATTSTAPVISCGSNTDKKNNDKKIEIGNITSNNGGLFDFIVKNVKMDENLRYNDLRFHFGIFNSKGKREIADFYPVQDKSSLKKGNYYDLHVGLNLFNDGGHDRNVNEQFKLGIVSADGKTLKTLLDEFTIKHPKKPDMPLTIKGSTINENWEKGSNDAFKKFELTISPVNMGTPYGATGDKLELTANLTNTVTKKVTHPEIKNIKVTNNGWNIYIDFTNAISQIKEIQSLTFSVKKSDNTVASESKPFKIPAADEPSITLWGTDTNMEGYPIKMLLFYTDIDNPVKDKFKAFKNGTEVEVKDINVGSDRIVITLNTTKAIGPGDTVKITYDSDKGLLSTSWSWPN